MNVDIHALYQTNSIGKARSAFLRGSNGGGSSGKGNNSMNGSGSLSRSPGNHNGGGNNNGGMNTSAINAEINRKDSFGRTVLHLASSDNNSWALSWVELLVGIAGCQINVVDAESGWTALHRALYAGNIAAARLLLARDDIIPEVKDREGLSAFDVFNSTVEGTNPTNTLESTNPGRLELFTFGSNRNFVLGFAGDGDRTFPERVPLKREEGARGLAIFEPLRVKDISMARLHTGIVTDERRNNIRLCGYGTGGRLGSFIHTQFTFAPLLNFPYEVASIVLSPDHSVIVTKDGDVYTFGLNKFSQLGYAIDDGTEIQSIPKRVIGALKKEVVIGVAASRTHTAAFTSDSLFTWGTNRGQLGYQTPNTTIQVLPRKVTAVPQPIIAVTATENATACLLETNEVLVLYHEAYIKIVFPLARFPIRMQTYRPPQHSSKPAITKIASCGNTFAALSDLGDVFTFILDSGTNTVADSLNNPARNSPKPQRVWSLRRKHMAVVDVAVASDGSIILCTLSGHVYVRTRKFEAISSTSSAKLGTSTPPVASSSNINISASARNYKVARIPYLQRCIKVSANSTGGFSALRSDVPLRFIVLEGATLPENLMSIIPHWRRIGPIGATVGSRKKTKVADDSDDEENETDDLIERDVEVALQLLKVLDVWDETWEVPNWGSDATVIIGAKKIPVHKTILASRSTTLAEELSTGSNTLHLSCTSDFSALLFIHYLYSDEFPAIWDSRIGMRIRELRPKLKLDVVLVKSELRELALRYGLEPLSRSLDFHVKTPPQSTLIQNIYSLFSTSLAESIPLALRTDLILELADKDIAVHSVVMRSRCTFFETFYEDSDWTLLRRDREEQLIRFDLKHVNWDVMEVVLDHIYKDGSVEMFEKIDRNSSDEYIDFVTQILSVANELLLDKLKLVCSAVLRGFITLHNVCSILVDAAFYEADDLTRTCLYYIASSMETVLEGRFLDDLPPPLLNAVADFVKERQGAKMPLSRSGFLITELMEKHADWLSELDIGRPTGGARKWRPSIPRSPALSPTGFLTPGPSPNLYPRGSPALSPSLNPLREDDEPFTMDDFSLEGGVIPKVSKGKGVQIPINSSRSTSATSSPYIVPSTPVPLPVKTSWNPISPESSTAPLDLRSIMAKESNSQKRSPIPSTSSAPITPRSSNIVNLSPSPSSSAPSWRPNVPSTRASLADIQAQQLSQPKPQSFTSAPRQPISSQSQRSTSNTLATSPSPSASSFSRPQNSNSGVGVAVITPVRLVPNRNVSNPSSLSNYRYNKSADIPWTNYNIAPTVASSPPPPILDPFNAFSITPPTFASIQSQQIAELNAVKEVRAPRSFAEVMAQEAAEELVKAEELAFEAWFAAESKRVAAEASKQTNSNSGGNKSVGNGSGGRGGKGGKKGGKDGKAGVGPSPKPNNSTNSSSPKPNPSANSSSPKPNNKSQGHPRPSVTAASNTPKSSGGQPNQSTSSSNPNPSKGKGRKGNGNGIAPVVNDASSSSSLPGLSVNIGNTGVITGGSKLRVSAAVFEFAP